MYLNPMGYFGVLTNNRSNETELLSSIILWFLILVFVSGSYGD